MKPSDKLLKELDDLLVEFSGCALRPAVSIEIGILAAQAVFAARGEAEADEDPLIDHSDLSNCCTAPVDTDYMICTECFEHCDLLPPYGEE